MTDGPTQADGGAAHEAARPGGWAALARHAAFSDLEHGRLPALLLALTVLSGIVDAASVLSLGHVFVANMTGNLVFIGFGLIHTAGFSLTGSVIAFGGFVLGVAGCRSWFPARTQRLLVLRDVLIGHAVLLAIAATLCGVAGGNPTGAMRYAVVGVTALAMGGQNAVARRMGVGELTTTVMTGTVVTLISNLEKRGVAEIRQTLSVLALVAGAVIGAGLVRAADATAALGVSALIASAVAVAAADECRRNGGAAAAA